MNVWLQTRIHELKIWLKVSTVMLLLLIFGFGIKYLVLAYEVNFEGNMVYWANPDVETQLSMLPPETPTPPKKSWKKG